MEPITKSPTITAGDLMELSKELEKAIAKRAMQNALVAIFSVSIVGAQQVLMYMILTRIGADTAMWVLYSGLCVVVLFMVVVNACNAFSAPSAKANWIELEKALRDGSIDVKAAFAELSASFARKGKA